MREGWIKDYRQETESAVWEMPPLYARVWQYLKYAACFEEKNIPMRDGAFVRLYPGQHLTSVRTIADRIGWYERGIFKTPNPKTIQDILDWMEHQEMIRIDNGRYGRQYSLITIVNWNKYQNPDDQELDRGNSSCNEKEQGTDIKKNYKKEKNEEQEEEKNKNLHMCEGSKNTDSYSDYFERFWKYYPRSIDKRKAYSAWNARLKDGVKESDLIKAALNYRRFCIKSRTDEKYIKHPSTFLGAEGIYEEYIDYDFGMVDKLKLADRVALSYRNKNDYSEFICC